MATSDKPSGMVESDRKLFAILNALKELDGAGVTELANHLGWPKSSVHKHLKTLESEGFLINEGGHYHLSLKFLDFGGHVRNRNRLCWQARSKVMNLAQQTGRVATFAVTENDYGWFTISRGLRFNRHHIGSRFYLHQNAVGKAMLSELPDDEVESIIDRRGMPAETEHTITDRETLFEALDRIRDRGFALNIEERTASACAVGASVYDPKNEQYGALSLAMPRHSVTREELEGTYATKVLAVVDELNLELRYS